MYRAILNCEGAKGSLVICVMYRRILNCEGAKGSLVSCVMYRGICIVREQRGVW